MAAGSGGASTRTHSPPGPSGATSQALVAAIQSGRPSMSMNARLPSVRSLPGLCDPSGEWMLLHLFEWHRQSQRAVGPLVDRARHGGTLLDGSSVVEGGGDEQRRGGGQGAMNGDDDLGDRRVLGELQ